MKKFLELILYLFPIGILGSAFVTEITINGQIKWELFTHTKSFYLMLLYSLSVVLFFKFKTPIKEKFKELIHNIINSFVIIMLKNPKIKALFSDIQETKKLLQEVNSPILPRVIYGKFSSQGVICLLSPSSLFSHDTIVSFYTYQDGFEELIAIGRVVVIQDDKKIQIVIQKAITENTQLINDIGGNKKSILENILVKPNVPQSYIQYLTLGDEME
ncbi:hypothetical protein BK726_27435 [Bacillus thuringiensis serovar londrina]|uniref:hypothetical protein n=1 Tax=Bacillus thuringiensis TaxID=1428 RepID=UPI000B45304D|nr:hypothetical protein [Bacillus thuringiensis]OTX80808.1 hypothetical protein BK726_27435 [Bacillus thuringiensis serovar londrina]